MTEQLVELAAHADDWPLRVLDSLAWRHIAAHRECIGWTMLSGATARVWCGREDCGWEAAARREPSFASAVFGLGALAQIGFYVACTFRVLNDPELLAAWKRNAERERESQT